MDIRAAAIDFLTNCAHGRVQEAYDKYAAPHFIHHNQYFKGDRQSLLDAMKDASVSSPNRSYTVKQSFVDGDRVATFSHVAKDDMDIAVVHMFRFEDEKIVEMWDVGQVVDKASPNQFGIF